MVILPSYGPKDSGRCRNMQALVLAAAAGTSFMCDVVEGDLYVSAQSYAPICH